LVSSVSFDIGIRRILRVFRVIRIQYPAFRTILEHYIVCSAQAHRPVHTRNRYQYNHIESHCIVV
jgi:hypothetical protein